MKHHEWLLVEASGPVNRGPKQPKQQGPFPWISLELRWEWLPSYSLTKFA